MTCPYIGGPTLHQVLHDLGLRHALAPNRRRTATQRGYINACGSHHVWSEETGEILFTGPASVCWEWLRETGRL